MKHFRDLCSNISQLKHDYIHIFINIHHKSNNNNHDYKNNNNNNDKNIK